MAGNETLFEFVLRYLARRLAGRTGASGQGVDRARTITLSSHRLAKVKANEKESPSKCLQELHLTGIRMSIQDAARVVFTDDEFSMA